MSFTTSHTIETEGMKALLFTNIRSYNERSDGSDHIYRKIKQIPHLSFAHVVLLLSRKAEVIYLW